MTNDFENEPQDIDVSGTVSDEGVSPSSDAGVFHKPGPNKRVCAFLIDSLLMNLLFWKLTTLIPWWGAYGMLYSFLIFRDSFGGSGPGKLIVGLQVIDEDGRPLDPLKGLKRNLSMLFGPFQLVEYFVMLKNAQGKRLGDKWARTVVTDKKPHLNDNLFLLVSIVILVLSIYVSMLAAPAGGKVCSLRTKRKSTCNLRNAPKPPAPAPEVPGTK